MIGQKITINGVEWEEVSRKEYDNIPSENTASFNFNDYYEEKYYKKVEQQVFPKVFEDEEYIITVHKQELRIEFKRGKTNIFYFNELFSLPLLKQALAFRDKLLEKK